MGAKITITNTANPELVLRKKENQTGQTTGLTIEKPGVIKLQTMATKVTTKIDVTVQNTGMIAEKTALKGNLSQRSTENPAMSGISPRKVNLPVTIGIDQWKERQGSGTTILAQSAYSVIGQKKAPVKNFMTTSHNTINIEDTPYSAIAPQSTGNMGIKKDDRESLDASRSSNIQTVTHTKPTVNPTAYQTPMYYGVGPPSLNQFPNIYRGPAPFYPTQVPVAHPHYLVPVPPPHIQPYHHPEINTVGGNVGFPSSMNSLGAISKQNNELLNSIIALMNHERTDPRNRRPLTSGQHPHRSLLPAQLQPADIAKLRPQINALLVQASADSLSTKSQSDSGVKSPVLPTGTSGASLSTEDIIRIREKKERLNAKRKNEKELCRREAMYMREELNKNLDKSRHAKKPRISHQPYASPASSTHSGEGRNDKLKTANPTASKSLESLISPDLPASSRVLQSVAAALTSPSPSTVPEVETMPRPTGIVTPNPRPIHPIFMESRNSFPLTEPTSSLQSVISSPSSAPDDRSRVISEIDQTLSVLKEEMQTNQNNTEVKDSMSKLLQLVIKLGGATPNDDQAETTEDGGVTRTTDPDSSVRPSSEDHRQYEEISDQTIHGNRTPDPTERTDLILNPAETPKDTIPFISDSSVIPFISDGSAFSHPTSSKRGAVTESIRNDALENPDNSVIPFISDDLTHSDHDLSRTSVTTTDSNGGEFPLSTSTGAGKYATHNIDELLSKVKPAIESINRMQSINKSDKHRLQADSSFVGEKIQVIGSVATAKVDQNLSSSSSKLPDNAVRSPANFTTVPSTLVTIVRPQPMPALTDIQPILSLAKNLEPVTVKVLGDEPSLNSTLLKEPETAAMALEDKKEKTECQSPSAKSDRGTPTLDERYPELTVSNCQEKNETKSNPFHVFNPDRSTECEAICLYLESVHGVHVDIVEVFGKLCDNLKALDKHSLDVNMLGNQYNAILPMGTLWVVFRSDDVSRLHLVPNIALLKAAGSRVQFVSANSVRDVRLKKYRNLFAGDGGIIVPLCPKTVLSKSDSFRHLLMWLIGQGKGCRSRNRWRIGLHQHILNALQCAQNSDNDIERDNARQISEWVCHANDVKPRVLIELPKHHCDSVSSTKVADAWNFYDRISNDKLAKSVLECAMKLQEDRADRLRHVVLLIDGDPGALCWHEIWQCGICVASVENFAEQICSKRTETPTNPLMSCVLPLYKDGLPCLIKKLGKAFLEM